MDTIDTVSKIKQQLANDKVVLYMKGTPQFPMCGFSARVAKILLDLGAKFAYINVLEHPDIRSELPKFADWPTFPQLYINSELIGGCDIVTEMHAKGELLPLLEGVAAI